MIIEIGDNGLRDRYWWTAVDVPDESDPTQAAYKAIRQLCPFLTDDNHTWKARDYGPTPESQMKIKQLTQSSRYSITVWHKEDDVPPHGYKFWFHMCYRVPGEES